MSILLAEDNELNQLVATEVLAVGGHECDVAENGREALEMLRKQVYDLVLMDCQMPEMSGFEASRAIRDSERSGEVFNVNGGPIPIIALTANALLGDREKCLQAGMDEYLTKPLEPDFLLRTIARCIHPSPSAWSTKSTWSVKKPRPGSGSTRSLSGDAIDLADLLRRCMGKREVMERVLRAFTASAPADFDQLETKWARGDTPGAKKAAHRMKGVAGNLGAHALRRRLKELERALRGNNDHAVLGKFDETREQLEACLRAAEGILEHENDAMSSQRSEKPS